MTKCICDGMMPPYCDVCLPINPSLEKDQSVCPKCEYGLFYSLDGGRLFCGQCRREVRNGLNFKGGKLFD